MQYQSAHSLRGDIFDIFENKSFCRDWVATAHNKMCFALISRVQGA